MTIPPSNDLPAAIVWTAKRADVPEDLGREEARATKRRFGDEVILAEGLAVTLRRLMVIWYFMIAENESSCR